MPLTIAIQPDDYTNPATGREDASSPRWAECLRAAGHEVRWVDVFRPDILEQLRGCHGFMWRHAHLSDHRQIARRLLPVIERDLGLPVYPDQNTCWHYDDKIAQAYLFQAHGIPCPRTWVWFNRELAVQWAQNEARYPLVLKLASGAGSTNVKLITGAYDAVAEIDRLFTHGTIALSVEPWAEGRWQIKGWRNRLRAALRLALKGAAPVAPPCTHYAWERQKNYALFQEFLPGNAWDTRVTVIGNRAFGFRRFNREGDFRASGSGRIDHDPSQIDPRFIGLTFAIASKLKMQSCAIDGLWRGEEPVVAEITYTYVSYAVHDCPGHWELQGGPEDGALTWVAGHMWPEEAQVQDFLVRLQRRWA